MRIPGLAILLLALPGPVLALDDAELALAYGDAGTVSIATGRAQALRRAPAVATVITAEELRAMGATDLEDALARVPGLHVSRSASFYTPLWVMRGVYSQYNQQVLLLWNGQPMTTALRGDRGSSAWRGLPLDSVARIEILRGPGSALYGAEAYAGVINIITKGGGEIDGQELGLRGGSFATRDAWLQAGRRIGAFDYAFYAGTSRSDGLRSTITADAQTTNDAVFGSSASLAPGPLELERELRLLGLELGYQRWRLRASYQQREFESGVGISQALDPRSLERTKRLLAELSWSETQVAEHLSAGASLGFQGYQQLFTRPLMIFPPGARFPTGLFPEGMFGAPETWERQWRLSAYLSYTGWSGHQWRLGVGSEEVDMYRTAEGRNFSYAPNGLPIPLPAFTSSGAPFLLPHRRRHHHAFLQDEWQLAPDWQLTAGLRHDRYDDVGGTTNPRLALVWDARHDLTLKLMHGRAFRAPSFAELYAITNPVARGNPAVRPETTATSEFALLWQPGRDLQAALNLFRFRMDDIIRPTPNNQPGTGTTFNNTTDQRGRGAELELRWQALPTLSLQASWSWQQGRDLANGLRPGYAPQVRALLLADWRAAPDWRLGLQLLQVGKRLRAAGDNRAAVPDYLSADLSLRWQPSGSAWWLAAQLRNAGDADVREPSLAPGRIAGDLPQAPRSLSLEAGLRF